MNATGVGNQAQAAEKLASKMLGFIGQAHYEREKGIAALVGVSQPTISRWMSGALVPDESHMTRIITLFHEACAHIRALFPVPANLLYLCSFAPKYTKCRVEEANEALRESVLTGIEGPRKQAGAVRVDLHIRAASLQNGARAHCFVDDAEDPSVFVILVKNSLTLREQYVVAFDEAYAHVMNKLIDHSSLVEHPMPFI